MIELATGQARGLPGSASWADPVERLIVLSPLGLEARAVRSGVAGARVLRSGMGRRQAETAAKLAHGLEARAVAVAGFCGALDPGLAAGEIVVATELRGPEGAIVCPEAARLAAALERLGITARQGPIVSVDHIVRGPERSALAASGALAVDME